MQECKSARNWNNYLSLNFHFKNLLKSLYRVTQTKLFTCIILKNTDLQDKRRNRSILISQGTRVGDKFSNATF
jgi:hypothetical protein